MTRSGGRIVLVLARSRGVEVHGDQYPYDWATNPLRFLLPTWLHEGGVSATLERLADPYVRSRISAPLRQPAMGPISASWHVEGHVGMCSANVYFSY